jgi:hypothetical protein
MSPSYIRKLLIYYGPNSDTISTFDSHLKMGWKMPFIKEQLSICEEIRKGIETYKFNSIFSTRVISKDARIHITKLNMLFINKECALTYLDEYTRQSLLYLIPYFSENEEDKSGFPLCDDSWFGRTNEDYLLYPLLHDSGRFVNGTCYSTWSFNVTDKGPSSPPLGPVFIPETKDEMDGKISNHFSIPAFKPPLFFPSNGGVMKVTKMEMCNGIDGELKSSIPLTWHLWKSKSTSVIKEESEGGHHTNNNAFNRFNGTSPEFLTNLEGKSDCNNNLVPDDEEVLSSSDVQRKECISQDCTDVTDPLMLLPQCLSCRSYDIDGDGLPDQCQDCNKNLISDAIDIRDNSALDRNKNGIIDSCESVNSYITNTDCNFNGRDDGLEIFSDPSLDEDRNMVIDDCEKIGVCSVDGQCMPSPKLKCEKFMRGIWAKDDCLFDKKEEIPEGGEGNETTIPVTQPIEPIEPIEPPEDLFIGSCKNSERECHDDVPHFNCRPPSKWSKKLRCAERRIIDKLEDNENLKHNVDTFDHGLPGSNDNVPLFWAILFSVLFFLLTTMIAATILSFENDVAPP